MPTRMVPTLAVCELCSQPSFLSPLKLGSFQIAKSCERVLQRFTAAPQASSLLEPFSGVWNPFRPRRHRVSAQPYRAIMRDRFGTWQEVVGAAPRP